MIRPLLCALAALCLARDALAFGPVGHEVVAEIAARKLDPVARAEVERLLGDRASNAMRQWANWGDDQREWAGYGNTGPLHYLNFPRGECRYRPQRDCRNGKCVVGALERFVGELGPAHPPQVRADALKWVIHLVADVHNPLHAGWGHDRGGNDVQLQFRGRGWNLHALWDSGMIRTTGLRAVPYADRLLARGRPASDLSWHGGAVQQWAEQSCAIVRDGLYPRDPRIDEAYLARNLPIVERRLVEAGYRLAAVLNAAMGRGSARSRGTGR